MILSAELVFGVDSPPTTTDRASRRNRREVLSADSARQVSRQRDTLRGADALRDTLLVDSMATDTMPKKPRNMIEDVMRGKNKDSLHYDVKNKKVFIYNEGVVNYQKMSLTADYMQIDMASDEIYAYGKEVDSAGVVSVTQPVFVDGGANYTMDTITYNIKSEKAKIKGVATQEGDGWLVGGHVKKMENNHINIKSGKYTTCNHTDHPHFYLAMTQAKVIPGEKVVTGPAYFVMEDVPLYFLGVPEGFFPINSGPRSGIIMPSYGEDGTKGFFLQDLGYYFRISDYMDLTLQGSIYSLGSWSANATSRYLKRYKYSGNYSLTYSNNRVGEKGDADFVKQTDFKIVWSHSQDAKANPGSSFSASVNFATSGYSKYSATTIDDMLSTQTNSTVAYSKSWSKSSFSTNMAVSQNSQDETISMTFPTAVYSVSRFYPFKSSNAVGAEKWYHKISMTYTGKMTNSISGQQDELFNRETLNDMKNGIEHSIPISASFSLFDYLNITPSFNYSENWYIKKYEQQWNNETNELDELDPEYGFYRLYDYSTSVSGSTTLYGMYQAKSKTNPVQAVRHTMTPTVSFSYTPDFSRQKYGYYNTVQTDSLGTTKTYSPYSSNAYGAPSSGENMSMSFSLTQSLEMKVLSKRDTSGVRKVKLIESLGASASYNFLADSMKLSTIPLSFRTTLFGNFGVNLSMTLDPYKVSPEGKRYDELFFPGRVTSTGWSFGYTFKSRTDKSRPAVNDINSTPPSEYTNPFYSQDGQLDPALRRSYMAASYYDFSLPWNVGFNYVINYGISYTDNGTTGYEPNVTQSVGFNGSLTLTQKTGVTFSGGFDIMERQLTTSSVAITRDLHCWQMSFSWIPFGYYRSWSFNIGIKASSLADIKYDKSQSMYDNLY